MAAASAVFELPDYLWAGVANDPLAPPNDQSRTWRDIKSIGAKNVRHPIKTVLSGLRLFSDVPMDGIDRAFGFREETHSEVQRILKQEDSYVLAA